MSVNPAKLYSLNCYGQQDTALADVASKESSVLSHSGAASCGKENVLRPYGAIETDTAADLVIFDPEETFIAGNYQSKSENTPFTGMELYGKIKYTICRGKIVWEG